MNRFRNMFLIACTVALVLSLGACHKATSHTDVSTADMASSSAVSSQETVDPALAKLAGNWYIDGDRDAAHIEITADGRFTAYYASGAVEQTGYLVHERSDDPMAQTDYRYQFYTDDGTPYMAFPDLEMEPFHEFYVDNGYSVCYVRIED